MRRHTCSSPRWTAECGAKRTRWPISHRLVRTGRGDQGDVFEASHVYKLDGMDKYLTVIEPSTGTVGGISKRIWRSARRPVDSGGGDEGKDLRQHGQHAADREHWTGLDQPRRTDPFRIRRAVDHRSRQPAVCVPGRIGPRACRQVLHPNSLAAGMLEAVGVIRPSACRKLVADGKLTPYCELPSGGDCSYAEAVEVRR